MVRPDPSNLKTLKLFFEENEYLSTTELAQIAGKSVRTIRLWRARCGIVSNGNGWGQQYASRPFKGVSNKRQALPIVTNRKEWDTKEWFWQKYVVDGFGAPTIARIINRDERIVWHKLHVYGIPIREYAVAASSKNKCCTREWLEEHYEIYGFPLHKCADLAGVTAQTICNWLARFNIHIRDRYEAQAGERHRDYGKPSYGKFRRRTEQVPAAP